MRLSLMARLEHVCPTMSYKGGIVKGGRTSGVRGGDAAVGDATGDAQLGS